MNIEKTKIKNMNRLEQTLKSKFVDGEYEEMMENLGVDITPSILLAMKEYAKECVIESLSEANKNFNIYQCKNLGELRNPDDRYLPADSGWYFAVDKESIVSESNVKLL